MSWFSNSPVAIKELGLGWRGFVGRTVSAQLHAFGCLLLVIEAFFLLPCAAKSGDAHWLACFIFLFTGILVFAVSSIYHFLYDGFSLSSRWEARLENLDQTSIYLFIAGTYTPFLLNTVSPPWQSRLLVGIWAIALMGISYSLLRPRLPKLLQGRDLYTALFVAMGLFLTVRLVEIFSNLTFTQRLLCIGGVLSYCGGAVIYARRWPASFLPHFGYHELWHFSVLLGAQFHCALVFSFYVNR